jgi:O-acetyl-ADP-ribose deacetylase (regulator of RNase III)
LDDSGSATRIEIIQGDLLSLAVDAIVNPTNEHLQHGGGLKVRLREEAESASRRKAPGSHP